VDFVCGNGQYLVMNRACRNRFLSWSLSLLALGFWSEFSTYAATTGRPMATSVDFNHEIRPILAENCFACHGPDEAKRKSGLRLDLHDNAVQPAKSGAVAIVPGHADQSELVKRTTSQDEDERMPPVKTGKRLTSEQLDVVKRWIDQGAEYKTHRFFLPPQQPELAVVNDKKWPRNPIDYFVLARLEKEGLKPEPEANRRALIRRVKLDLLGLPPTPAEVDEFLADRSADAYERMVDRFMASPHFGERMAVDWLDAARFADTHGYHIDSGRDMTHWRDWVINAYNRNQPFDQFTVEQIAGDLLPNATREQKLASGFNRNHMINFEGGAIPEEYHAAYLIDRVNTTTRVWLGLTVACAQCHDHKYDPITQKDYYQLYAFFNNVPENSLDGDKGNAIPVLLLPGPENDGKLAKLKGGISAAEDTVKKLEAELPAAQVALETEWRTNSGKHSNPDGLVARFSFDKTTSRVNAAGVVMEAVYHGSNAPAWTTGKLGQALEFDGNENWVEGGGDFNPDRTDAFSLGGWVRMDGERGAVLSKMEGEPSFRGFALLYAQGKLVVELNHQRKDNALRVRTKDPVPSDTWLHVFATYDGSGKAAGVKIYSNGQEQALEVLEDNLTASITNALPLHIGARFNTDFFKGAQDDVRLYARALGEDEVSDLVAEPVRQIVAVPAGERTDEQKSELTTYVRQHRAPELVTAERELASQRKAEEEFEKTLPSTMVMQEMDKPRDTFVLQRGQYDKPGEKVVAAIPEVFGALPEGSPTNRLGLARWLVAPTNPLTARVMVNRFWQMYFGTGIVKTSEDFGTQGEWPSHPELLDWLALQFMHSGWDVKALQKLILTSATYRQSSATTSELAAKDPENRLLAHGPRQRLQAEFIRDQALAISGILNDSIGGASVSPYQPPGLWEELASREDGKKWTAQTYTQSHGPDLYRRTMYTFWKRTSPPPTLSTFDAPDRETCTVRRLRTNTPLQALILMNDPTYVEASRKLAERLLSATQSDKKRVELAFQLALARPPAQEELAVLLRIAQEQIAVYRGDQAAAAQLLGVGEAARNQGLDSAELAAWTIIANVILNLDETITKG
jgi:hypothetical protein